MRFIAKIRARLGGHFWLPCPLCGSMFGGHEWHDRDGKSSVIYTYTNSSGADGKGICPTCTREGRGDQFHVTGPLDGDLHGSPKCSKHQEGDADA